MIEIPIGKAITAVENFDENCKGCCFLGDKKICLMKNLSCFNSSYRERKDGKNVVFKLVNYKGE